MLLGGGRVLYEAGPARKSRGISESRKRSGVIV